ncbi:conjugal transfer protein [Enterococcus faecalis]|nr:conjugal transfer protein [Enterococcus faecalis]
MDNRMESLKGYLTDELQVLNVDTVRKDIPVSSSVRGFQIWTVEPTGDNEFNVTYSVDQLITEEKIQRPSTLLYSDVYVDGWEIWYWLRIRPLPTYLRNQVINQKPLKVRGRLIPLQPMKSMSFNDVLQALYPTATASELSYYVNDGILKPIGKRVHLSRTGKSYSQS